MIELFPPPPQPLQSDPCLSGFLDRLRERASRATEMERHLAGRKRPIEEFASGHEHFGLHRRGDEWVFREWAPNATQIHLVGDMTHWREEAAYRLSRVSERGEWELRLPGDALKHGDLYHLSVHWHGGCGKRLPAYARRVVQDPETLIFSAQVWAPPEPYCWCAPRNTRRVDIPFVYEAHIGMAQETESVGTYEQFRRTILPRIAEAGYNTIQLMAIQEHPYYGSFGYHVSSFFAASSRFGTPEELKALVDAAHQAGIAVIIDLVHSHAASNEVEGISRFDGTEYQYFHAGSRGKHQAWDSRCFDYGKPEVLHFLLSNCRYWLDEFNLDGFRFDGITSMLYHDHGLGTAFGCYEQYFDNNVDEDAVTYLYLANRVIHRLRPDAITVAEDMSGMPGLAAPIENGGCGFDYRLAMGIPDCWFKLLTKVRDEDWHMGWLWHELCNRRADERTISYAECHDQAIVGGKTVIFELIDSAMYHSMSKRDRSLVVDRGMALHKMIRLITAATAGHGYLNFMGNEFGHPEWIDFPREGNGWSYHHARRRWSLRDDPELRFHYLADFDRALVRLLQQDRVVGSPDTRLVYEQNEEKILAFTRAECVFAFNFHPTQSRSDHPLCVPAGEYELVFSTDDPEFGGHGEIEPDQRFRTAPGKQGDFPGDYLQVYLPARTAIVLRGLR